MDELKMETMHSIFLDWESFQKEVKWFCSGWWTICRSVADETTLSWTIKLLWGRQAGASHVNAKGYMTNQQHDHNLIDAFMHCGRDCLAACILKGALYVYSHAYRRSLHRCFNQGKVSSINSRWRMTNLLPRARSPQRAQSTQTSVILSDR